MYKQSLEINECLVSQVLLQLLVLGVVSFLLKAKRFERPFPLFTGSCDTATRIQHVSLSNTEETLDIVHLTNID